MATRNRKNPKVSISGVSSVTRPTTHTTDVSKGTKTIGQQDYKHDSNVSLPDIKRSGSKKENENLIEYNENFNLTN
jgi:hypothetical protein